MKKMLYAVELSALFVYSMNPLLYSVQGWQGMEEADF